jgi:desulfoferrodoxin (superoxide reductase-like protein)
VKIKFALFTLVTILGPATAFAQAQDVEKIGPDFEKPKGEAPDAKHTPVLDAPASVTAGDWFPVKISIGKDALHPSWHEHHVRWISLEADGVEINRVYLHPTMSKPEVTFTIALPDTRTFDKDGNVTARKDRVVTLRAVEAPTHTSQWWTEKKVTVKALPKK